MINTKYLLCISTCLLVSGNVQATEINLTYDSSGFLPDSFSLYTLHTPSELKPTFPFNFENAVKLAAVCSVGGGGCSKGNFDTSENSLKLDRNLLCTQDGFSQSCSYGYTLDKTDACPYNASFFRCRVCSHDCTKGSLTTCTSQQVQTGTSTNDCLETCYQCRDKTCEEGGFTASLNSCQNGTSVSFANKTCYSNVTAKTCENGGYKSSVPTNNKCTAVNYCNKTCQSNCYQPTCDEGGYKSDIPTNHICTQVTYYGRKCFNNCYQPQCTTGGYLAAIPDRQICSSVTYYGRTCYKDCKNKECVSGTWDLDNYWCSGALKCLIPHP